MAIPLEQFKQHLAASGLLSAPELESLVARAGEPPRDAEQLARLLVREQKLTAYQAQQIYAGKGKSLLLGNYVVLAKLGQGGMGMVLKAEHRRMKRLVALKVLSPAVTKSPEALRRFQREVEAAAKLSHPNIVIAHDADEAGGTHFLVMEYVEGTDLSKLVREQGALPVDKAVDYVLQAARGLEYAHTRGVVHRDIKPANLLLDSGGTVKILDMGLARIDSAGPQQDQLTGTGEIMGTVDYMAPEQAVNTKQADARADIYSLGVTLWYLLTCRPLFEGETVVMKLLAHQTQPTPSLREHCPQVPPALDAVFQRMVAKTPEARYQTMTELIAELEQCRQGAAATPVVDSTPGEDTRLHDFFQQLKSPKSPAVATKAAPKAAVPKTVASAPAEEATVALQKPQEDTDPETQKSLIAPAASRLVAKRKAGSSWWQTLPATVRRRMSVLAAIAGGLAALLLAGIVLFIQTSDGVIRVEINDPAIEVAIKGTKIVLKKADQGKDVSLSPGEKTLVVERGDFKFETDKLILRKGETVTVSVMLAAGKVQVRHGERLIGEGRIPSGEIRQAARRNEPSTGATDVLSLVNVERDNLFQDGRWEWQDEQRRVLKSTGKRAHLQIPLTLADDYRLRLRVQKAGMHNEEGLVLGLRVAGHAASMVLGYQKDGKVVSGFVPPHMPECSSFPMQRDFELQVTVRGRTVLATVDGQTIFQFDGDPRELVGPGEQYWVRRDTTQLSLGAAPDSWRINVFEYFPLVGGQAVAANAPPLAIAPFDAEQAKQHQEAWARHLGVPVEFTNTIGMKFQLIPPGEFTMGMTKEESEVVAARLQDDEVWKDLSLSASPAHRIRLTQAYYLSACEVTQEQYEKVIGNNPAHFSATGPGKDSVADEDTRQHPVEMVCYIDAADFCIKLNKQEQLPPVYSNENNMVTLLPGNGYRMPTEAEWEWACRAGTTTFWSHGEQESELGTVAWYGANAGGRTHVVGQLKANPFGLHDMHGNVWEWCQDWYDSRTYAQREAVPIHNPQGPAAGSSRVLRGGDWNFDSLNSRSAFRGNNVVESRLSNHGFRVLVSVDAVKAAIEKRNTKSVKAPTSGTTAAPPLAIAPFNVEQAKQHQEAWARHLGIPVEFTNTIGMKFQLIPPGEFTMGMSKEEAEAVMTQIEEQYKNFPLSSVPAHHVRLTQAYYLGTCEVTQEQYEKVIGSNPAYFSADGPGKDAVANENPRQHPVEQVSYIDAAEFCIKLNKKEQLQPVYSSENNVITLLPGDGYRLPTEAEWEWACRAGTTTFWSHGELESELETVAWYNANSGRRTHAVGQLKANPFGLYDMHGNVWEWCQDWYDAQTYAQREAVPIHDPQGPDAGSARVLRGGNCHFLSSVCRSAFRSLFGVGSRNGDVGFRVLVGLSVVRTR